MLKPHNSLVLESTVSYCDTYLLYQYIKGVSLQYTLHYDLPPWSKLKVSEQGQEQRSNCFPSTAKVLQVSSARKYSENKWNQVRGQDNNSMKVNSQNQKSILTAVADRSTVLIGVTPP